VGFGGASTRTAERISRRMNKLPYRCNVLRAILVDDGRSGKREDWAAVNTEPIACSVAPFSGGSGKSEVEGEKPTAIGMCLITLPAGTDVKASDRIQMTAPTSEAGKVYQLDNAVPGTIVNIQMAGRIRNQ
jgi:hypothetical protein